MGIIVGYVVSIPLGLVSFTGIQEAAWIGLPTLTFPVFQLDAILIIAPVAFVVIIEHIGHLLVINEITGKDFTPMLPESLFGDGIATMISGAVGGTPSTTYAENIGVMAVTKVYATQLFWFAGAFAFLIGGFIPKFSAAISSIPTPVMGGISLLLFGLIATSGIRLLANSGIDFSHSRNLILASVVLVIGVGMEAGGVRDPARQVHRARYGTGRTRRCRTEPHSPQGERGSDDRLSGLRRRGPGRGCQRRVEDSDHHLGFPEESRWWLASQNGPGLRQRGPGPPSSWKTPTSGTIVVRCV